MRPLRSRGVAGHPLRVGIAFAGPSVDNLAGLLRYASQRPKRAGRKNAGLLLKLPASGGQRLFASVYQSLWDGPNAGIAAGPERTAGMSEKYLQPALAAAEQQQPGAFQCGFLL